MIAVMTATIRLVLFKTHTEKFWGWAAIWAAHPKICVNVEFS